MVTQLDKCVQVVVEKLRQIQEHEEEILRRQDAIRNIKDHLEADLLTSASNLDQEELKEFGYLLYWHTIINTDTIARLLRLKGSGSVAKFVGSLPCGEYCDWCDEEFMYESRSDRANRLSAKRREERAGIQYVRLCDECRQKSWEQREAQRQREKETRAEQIAAYRTMPYRDYLETEHWQAVRKSALKRSRRRCQLCNAEGVLDVHHRTYERIGEEDAGDVIVLCRACHSKFHDKT